MLGKCSNVFNCLSTTDGFQIIDKRSLIEVQMKGGGWRQFSRNFSSNDFQSGIDSRPWVKKTVSTLYCHIIIGNALRIQTKKNMKCYDVKTNIHTFELLRKLRQREPDFFSLFCTICKHDCMWKGPDECINFIIYRFTFTLNLAQVGWNRYRSGLRCNQCLQHLFWHDRMRHKIGVAN